MSMLVGDMRCYGSLSDVARCYGFRYGYYSRIPSYACTPYSQNVAGVRCIGEYARVCKGVL